MYEVRKNKLHPFTSLRKLPDNPMTLMTFDITPSHKDNEYVSSHSLHHSQSFFNSSIYMMREKKKKMKKKMKMKMNE